jgi:calcium permeable stress-gated cation channel
VQTLWKGPKVTYSTTDVQSVRRRIKKLDHKIDTLKEKVKTGIESTLLRTKSSDPNAEEKPSTSVEDAEKGASTAVQLDGAPELFRQLEQTESNAAKSDKSSTRHHSFAPAAPAEEDPDLSDDDDDPNEHAFDHPSTYVEQPWIWIPRDPLGLSEVLVKELKEAGVEASDTGATMDTKGLVEVERNPPDEEWTGGHDL